MNLLAEHAANRADIAALVDGERRWTWQDVYVEARAIAGALQRSHGVVPGDTVATIMENTAAHVILLHAIFLCGAAAAPLNLRLTTAEGARQIEHLQPRLVVVDGSAGRDGIPFDLLTEEAKPGGAGVYVSVPPDEERCCSILFTSGTSGVMKAVPHSWRNHRASAEGSAANLGVRSDDNWLCVIPLCHIGGLAIVTRSLFYGTAMTVRRGFDTAAVLETVREGSISLLSLVPTMLQRMVDADAAFDASSSPALRAILLGGAAAPRALWDEAVSRGLPVLGTYGLTETCSQVVTASPADMARMAGSAGRPIDGAEIRIQDENGAVLPNDAAGEICIRGAMVAAGYLRNAELSAERFVRGWFHTGDVGMIDREGCLHVLGRRDDMIVTGGENVYPSEIEDVLARHAAVREAAVTGVADEDWGQRIAAVVVLSEHVAFAELADWCRRELAGYKIPRLWMQMDALPRTASGKLLRDEVREIMERLKEGLMGGSRGVAI